MDRSFKILLDECLPRSFRNELPDYEVRTVAGMKWSGITNGKLLRLAEAEFDVFITIDKNMPHQQNLSSSKLGIIVMNCISNRIEDLRPLSLAVLELLLTIRPGDLVQIG